MRNHGLFRLLLILLSFLMLGAAIFFRSDRTRLSDLRISAEQADELVSLREETDLRLLKEISFNGYPLFQDDRKPNLYYSLVENDSNANDPYVHIDGSSDLVRVALVEGEITEETIEHNLPLQIIAYNDQVYREYLIYCTTLPLMNIESEIESIHGTQKDRDLKMTLFDNRAEARQRLIDMNGLIHVRGNVSTTYFPKQGYKMTLYQTSLGNHKREADISLLGMERQDGEWLLYAGYNDQERIRNVFSCTLWNRSCAGENEFNIKNGLEYRFVELFMNGKYWGLYALGYPLDYKQMTPKRGTEEVQAVYVYKKSFWTENYSDLPTELEMRDYQIRGKDALANESTARSLLAEYDYWLKNNAEGNESQPSGIRGDITNSIDTLLFVILVQGMDTVEDSGNFVNMFLTLVIKEGDPVMLYTPWDLDLSWGNIRRPKIKNNTVPYGLDVDDNSYIMLRNPAYFLARNDPEPIIERYHELRKTGWSDTHIDSLLDDYEQKIFNSGAYRRDTEKWPKSTMEDPELKLSVFREYVHNRLSAMDRYINEEFETSILPQD